MSKDWKSAYMRGYWKRRRENEGKPLGMQCAPKGERFLSAEDFKRMFMVPGPISGGGYGIEA